MHHIAFKYLTLRPLFRYVGPTLTRIITADQIEINCLIANCLKKFILIVNGWLLISYVRV